MKKTLFILLTCISSSLFAQKGSISGYVIDSLTQKPVEFTTIAILDQSGKPINGTICDENGKFSITKIDKGNYQLVVSFVGYGTKRFGFEVKEKGIEFNLGRIVLSPSAKMLHEVIVQGQKTLVEEKVDRTIYNAEQDATTKGGDATDVLKRVPLLTVDVDGNVSLRGSANVKVLINNKPSTISANSVADALKQIPADMIKTVEVITSPSSKYDAEGSGGIINIVLKKKTLEGTFVNADVTAGSRGSNVGVNTSYRKGKMGFSLGGFFRPTYNIVSDFSNEQVTKATQTTYNTQTAHNRNDGVQETYTLVWDYDINKNNSLSTSVRYGSRNQNSYQDQLFTTTQYPDSAKTTLQNVQSDYTYYIASDPYGSYAIDNSRASTGFNYNQSISAAYASYTLAIKEYTLKAGSRYEYTDIQAHFKNQPNISIPSYGVMVPSVNLSRKLKNGNLFKISYNKRIQRPNLRDLNPKRQASNPKSATQGNPNLKPEYTHQAEIAYKTSIKEATINLSAFMRYNTNDIQAVRIIRNDTIISIAQNIGTEANYGISVFVTVPVSDKFTINGGTDTFYRILKNNSSDLNLNATKQGLTPNFRLFRSYNFSRGWSFQFFGSYQGRSYNLQGYRTSPINHSVSVKKNIWGKNGSISLGLDNFATPSYLVRSQLNSVLLDQTTKKTLHNFVVKVSFSYKFGRVTQDKKKELVEDDSREN